MMVLAAVAAILLAEPMRAETGEGEVDQATMDKITTQLTAEGYEVRKIVTEEGSFEVYALKDGKKYTVYLDAALKTTKTQEATN